jgi:hypothetical protein
MQFKWLDETHVATVDYPGGTRIPRPLEIEYDDSAQAAEEAPDAVEEKPDVE